MSNIPTIEEMLKAGMHFGHRTSKWHPKMEPFIFTKRNGVHIIDLVKSRQMLAESLDFMKKFAQEGKIILFVGTKMQVKKNIKKMAEEVGMPYVEEKWLGGTLTNFPVIRKMIKKYKDLLSDKQTGRLSRYTKKEQLEFDRETARLRMRVGGMADMNRLPDAIFIWDIKTEKTAVEEAKKRNIPIIAICDTNVNPTDINYPIPSNDDATKTVKMLIDCIGEAIKEGKKEKAAVKTPTTPTNN
jgi:small subunit ribosomal protein S2